MTDQISNLKYKIQTLKEIINELGYEVIEEDADVYLKLIND